jgi:hypothetical protein
MSVILEATLRTASVTVLRLKIAVHHRRASDVRSAVGVRRLERIDRSFFPATVVKSQRP